MKKKLYCSPENLSLDKIFRRSNIKIKSETFEIAITMFLEKIKNGKTIFLFIWPKPAGRAAPRPDPV
jgi:hypothetical protein